MSAAVVQVIEARSTGTTSLVSPAFNSAGGRAQVCSVHCSTSSTISTPTDTDSNAWTLIGTAQTSSGQQAVYLAQNVVGSLGVQVTVGFSTSEAACFFIQDVSGVLASCYDSGSLIQGTNAGATCAVTTGTLAQADSLIMSLVGSGLGAPITFSETDGFTVDGSEGAGTTYWPGACAHKNVNATTAVSSSWTSNNSTGLTVTAFALKSAPTNGLGKPLNVKGPLFAGMALPNAGDTTIGPAGTNTNLTPGVGSIAFTGYAPTIAQPQTANPGAASIVFTGYAPTVAQPQTAAPGAASITFTGYAPTVSQPQTAAPGAGSIIFTGYAPTVSQPQTAAPGAGTITFTGYAPTVSQPQTAAPGAASIVFTGYAPTVGQGQSAAPGAGSIAITGYAPTVARTANQALAPGVGSITFTGFAPTVVRTGAQTQKYTGGFPYKKLPPMVWGQEKPTKKPKIVIEHPKKPERQKSDIAAFIRAARNKPVRKDDEDDEDLFLLS